MRYLLLITLTFAAAALTSLPADPTDATYRRVVAPAANLYVDRGLSPLTANLWAESVTRAQERIESHLHLPFNSPPTVFIVTNDAQFASLLQTHFGVPFEKAYALSRNSGGVSFGDKGVVVNARRFSPEGEIVRHELVHVLLAQYASLGAWPLWFEEGLATTVGASSKEHDRVRYTLGALVYAKRTPDLSRFVSASDWTLRSSEAGVFAYEIAGAATLLALDTYGLDRFSQLLYTGASTFELKRFLNDAQSNFDQQARLALPYYR